jgi:DNA repair protein RadC
MALMQAMLSSHALSRLDRFGESHRNAMAEAVLARFLARDGQILAEDRTTSGSGHAVDLPIRRIAARALLLEADEILIAHNHPGGDPTPSRQDILATNRLERALFPFAIRLTDHVIVAGGASFSFRQAGLL